MNDLDSTACVTEQASHWWVLLNCGPATPADHQAFGEWVARSPERVEAFLETALVTKALKSQTLRWPDTPVEELARQVLAAGDVVHLRGQERIEIGGAPNKKRSKLVWAIAASVGFFTLAAGWLLSSHSNRYATGVGEQRSVLLSDGSLVTLNTASHILVEIQKDRRSIQLLAGEALFQVAKDSSRPFDVVAGATTVRAIGTQFNVNTTGAVTTVTVVEGKVAVREHGIAYLTAGQQVAISRNKPQAAAPMPVDIAVAMAWTQRRLVFEHRPLGDVANEFNRYNVNEIRIQSPALRAQEVTGVFQANDPESFLQFVSKIPGVRIQRDAGATTVFDSP